jgi:deoxyribodipyrimidine photolyase-related protein
MSENQPMGGQWNFDKENRQPPKGKLKTPDCKSFVPDKITCEVIAKVNSLPFATFGELKSFSWGVTREEALQVLDYFVRVRLKDFGIYQDAMVTGEETMWHSLISPYLNIGLLQPLEVIKAVENAFYAQNLPLNNVEGFIRQVLGWREYMHSVYHYVDDNYFNLNWFNHQRSLPDFFWTGDTKMNCLHEIITQIKYTGYAHHIQRLMVLSNFALIAGISPQEVESWFHATFIDAYDWVMQTNVLGMGLFADGGVLASKPYAASANYINKMSDYCQGCVYNHKERTGENACPFNFFYWNFLAQHREKLQTQGRMSFILKNLDKMPVFELDAIRKQAKEWEE